MTAQDVTYSQAKGDSNSVFFIPKDLRVALSPPPGTRAGESLYTYYTGESFTVTTSVRDELNRIITTYGGLVNISTAAGLVLPKSYQFISSDQGSYSFEVATTSEEAPFVIDVKDAQQSGVVGSSSPKSQVLTAIVQLESAGGPTGKPIEVTVKMVDSNGNIIKQDNTAVGVIFWIGGMKLSEDSMLPTLKLPQSRTITLVNGKAKFKIESSEIQTVLIGAASMPGSVVREAEPLAVHIGSIGSQNVHIRSWSEMRTPSEGSKSKAQRDIVIKWS